jgi:phage tail sheath protein FI
MKITYPGVYVQEIPSGLHVISGVPTSRTAFIGTAVAGTVNQPVHAGSFAEFELQFGGVTAGRELACAVMQFFLNGGMDAWAVRVPDSATDADWLGGLAALDPVDPVNLLVLPGVAAPAVVQAAVAYCEKRRAFLILDPPIDAKTPDQILQRAGSGAMPESKNAAVYFPWIGIPDPQGGALPRLSAPSGSIAGLFARTDSERGVWKAPAGLEADLRGVMGLDYALTDAENGVLNPQGINCLRTFAATGPVAWGARTLAGADALASEWKYIPVRRLALFIEESLYQGTKWVVFEPNDEPLWAQIRQTVGAFMQEQFRRGAFQGSTPKDAYFVKCDKETTTQDDINLGIVNILVGFAPLKAGEFVVFQIQQMAEQAGL